jgi:hypothetical protein
LCCNASGRYKSFGLVSFALLKYLVYFSVDNELLPVHGLYACVLPLLKISPFPLGKLVKVPVHCTQSACFSCPWADERVKINRLYASQEACWVVLEFSNPTVLFNYQKQCFSFEFIPQRRFRSSLFGTVADPYMFDADRDPAFSKVFFYPNPGLLDSSETGGAGTG